MTLRSNSGYETIGDKYSQANLFDDLSMLYRYQKHYDLALTAINQAIDIFPHAAWYQNRAALYMKMDDYETAEVDIKQAELMNNHFAYTLLRKAELALWQQQAAQALELSQQALAQRPTDGCFRAIFALTLLANGQHPAADTEMEQALTAIYQPHDVDDLLEQLDKLARIYGHSAEIDRLREKLLSKKNFIHTKTNAECDLQ